jgi:uncharacterized protein YycO
VVLAALHRGGSWIGKLIEWQTRSHYSHAALVFPSREFAPSNPEVLEGCEVVESREFHGVRVTDGIVREPGTAVDLFRVAATDRQAFEVREFARRQIGKPYDYTMVARFISRRGESIHSKQNWFCSELVFAAFLHAGLALLRDTAPWEVSPGLLSKSPFLSYAGTLLPEIEPARNGKQIPWLVREPQPQFQF